MALPIIAAKVAAVTGGAALLGSAFEDSGDIRHHPPQQGRTQYLPIRGDGDVDGNSAADPTSTDALDDALDEINAATLDYDAAHLYSFCDDESCTKGCATTPEPPQLLVAAEKVAALFDRFEDQVGEIATTLSNFAGEQTADRLISVYAGDGTGSFSLPEAQEGADVVRAALAQAVEASEVSARDALAVNRVTVQSMRNSIAEKAVNQLSAENALWMAPLALTGVGAVAGVAVGAAKTAWDVWQSNKAEAAGPAAVEAAKPMLEAAAAKNDEAVANLRQALRHWKVSPNQNAIGKLAVDSPTPPAPLDSTPPTTSSALPGVGGGAGGTTSEPSVRDALDALLAEPMPEMPPSMMPSGMDSGMGGMPSGGMPSGMGGAPMSDPMSGLGSEPLTDPLEDELLDDEPLDDLTEGEDDELGEPLDDVTEGEEAVAEGLDTDDSVTDPDDSVADDVEESPEAGDVAPVEADPSVPDVASDDVTARTVDVGNGRMVTFPSAPMADAVARLVDSAESGGGKTLYLAMSEAGYQLPPMGNDIGEIVPPALLAEGDIVVGQDATGVYLGNGDVLLENGSVVPLSEAAAFGGENQGLFRVAEPEPTEPGLHGPAQPVGDGSTSPLSAPAEPATVSTPGEVIEDVAQPGVPTDTAADDLSATDDTLAGLGTGITDDGAPGLDPGTAFPN